MSGVTLVGVWCLFDLFCRVTRCKYVRIGCPWQGPFHELPAHEAACCHPSKSGQELMGILSDMDQQHRRELTLYSSIFNLLCFEKIGFTGAQTLTCNMNMCYDQGVSHSNLYTHLRQSSAAKTPIFWHNVLLYLLFGSRGAVPAISHGWFHHTSVLWDATIHRAQSDLGTEGAGQWLRAEPQPVMQAYAFLPAHSQEQGQHYTGVSLPAAEGPLRWREDPASHPAPHLFQWRQRDWICPPTHYRLCGVQQATGRQEHQPASLHLPNPEMRMGGAGGMFEESVRKDRRERSTTETQIPLNDWEEKESGKERWKPRVWYCCS